MNSTSRRPSPATMIAVIALVLALGGTAAAAQRYLITNTKQISPAVLKKLASMAAAQGSSGASGPQGPRGEKGATGDRGPIGAQGPPGSPGTGSGSGSGATIDWAVVNSTGTIGRTSDSGATINKLSGDAGTYAVVFSEDVTNCAYQATVGRPTAEATEDPGFVTVVSWAEDPDGVLVQTYGTNGVLNDKGFHLTVFC